jgi:ATP-dependent Clp protease ATP-binding subunit ClpA
MVQARNDRLEFVTVEHLLLALLGINEVLSFLRSKRVNVKEMQTGLEDYIDRACTIIALISCCKLTSIIVLLYETFCKT